MISGPGEEIGQPSPRIDVIEPGGDDQRIQRSGPLDAPVTAGEQLRAATQGDAAQGALHGIVGQADPPVTQEAVENSPSLQHIVHCLVTSVNVVEFVVGLRWPRLMRLRW